MLEDVSKRLGVPPQPLFHVSCAGQHKGRVTTI
jgi:hypothetical protein